HHRIDRFYHP
ncbi:hypothetical protein D047_4311B, partial [Vibrio parahaemolyticus VPTS-2010_2]